jgi:hypothetical protein
VVNRPDVPAGETDQSGISVKDDHDMDINKGNRQVNHAGARLLALSSLTLLLVGCIHWPEIASDCESYGVLENHQPMGQLVSIEALYTDELNERCQGVKPAIAMINPEANIKGCIIPAHNGAVSAYYSVGDRCAKYHEMCHAMHGGGHTERYERELENGIPMPYCPQNQLKFPISSARMASSADKLKRL